MSKSKFIDYVLPEWSFLEANVHTGNELEGRTVILHAETYTTIEAICLDELEVYHFQEVKCLYFTYNNCFGEDENHVLLLHKSLVDDYQVDEILEKAREWYCDYMDWEDGNILDDIL